MRAEDFMTVDFPMIHVNMKVREVLEVVKQSHYSYLPVVDDKGFPSGVLWTHKLLGVDLSTSLYNLLDDNFIKLNLQHPVSELLKLEFSQLQCPLIVINNQMKLVGFIPSHRWIEISFYLNSFCRHILDSINKAMVVVDNQGFITYVSKKWETIHGISRIEGEYIGDRFPESGLIDVIHSGMPYIKQKISFSSTGVTVLPVYKPILNENGDVSGAIAVVEDESNINRFKLVAQNIMDIEKNLSIIFQSLNDAIIITNMKGDIFYANNGYNELFSSTNTPKTDIANRPVFLTDFIIVSLSRGTIVRKSITSAFIPSSANFSAASIEK